MILHLDLDSFFASVEQARNPQLLSQPVVVGTPSKKAVITAASYEAKKFGIKPGMPFFIAKKLCSNLIIIPAHFSLYSKYSGLFFKYLKNTISPNIEIGSIDECYIDLTNILKKTYIDNMAYLHSIQQNIYKKLRLKVSLGLSFNKEFAKIAANMKKPLGIQIITKNNFKNEIWPLSIEKISGIGKATLPHMYALQINTIGDLANYKQYKHLKNILGIKTEYFLNVAKGKGTTKLTLNNVEQKSISKDHTFASFIEKDDECLFFIKKLAIEIVKRIQNLSLVANVIKISYKNNERKRKSIQMTLQNKTDDFQIINKNLLPLYEKISHQRPFNFLSFGLGGLENKFDYYYRTNKIDKLNDLNYDLIHYLNTKYKKRIIMSGDEWNRQKNIKYYDRFLKGDKTNE